jgi:hypothetical protein
MEVRMLAGAIRRLRGKRSRREVIEEIEQKTGVRVSGNYVGRLENDQAHPRLDWGARVLILAYPQLAVVILGEDMCKHIAKHCGEGHGESEHSPL